LSQAGFCGSPCGKNKKTIGLAQSISTANGDMPENIAAIRVFSCQWWYKIMVVRKIGYRELRRVDRFLRFAAVAVDGNSVAGSFVPPTRRTARRVATIDGNRGFQPTGKWS
jgi:hypothetical protein